MAKQIIRQIDETGRLVLPKPFREMLGLKLGDKVMISMNDDAVLLRKYADNCIFCGSENAAKFRGTPICKECARKIAHMAY